MSAPEMTSWADIFAEVNRINSMRLYNAVYEQLCVAKLISL